MANPRGFCAGVDRAINIVNQALILHGPPVYVKHELVHNNYVISSLRKKGVIFIEHIKSVPEGSVLIFSAHGVSQDVKFEANQRNLIIFDATCPLVNKVHMEVIHASNIGMEVILIGHSGHPEVEGTIGQYSNRTGGIYLIESIDDVWSLEVNNAHNLYYTTQTTLSVGNTLKIIHALRCRFPFIKGPKKSDICYATVNRQKAVYNLAIKSDIIFVVGSHNSSNSNRLAELVKHMGKLVYLIDNANDIQESWIINVFIVGITAGASAPDILVSQVINKLKMFNIEEIIVEEMDGYKENVFFRMPKKLNFS
ncbi:4-hydroxy-3-methylbut-2-enyl diphosphate reductase [Blochmannia endosymbiont of Camponotus (Colobopsis) obliquus]|nr:4-hydroxy-3-methylbut-2-enyl diphosphate reductase [Blochmannia endosymbiont of Camponotus (Colobopsis) obliquus]